jgi:hypothetical protein
MRSEVQWRGPCRLPSPRKRAWERMPQTWERDPNFVLPFNHHVLNASSTNGSTYVLFPSSSRSFSERNLLSW